VSQVIDASSKRAAAACYGVTSVAAVSSHLVVYCAILLMLLLQLSVTLI